MTDALSQPPAYARATWREWLANPDPEGVSGTLRLFRVWGVILQILSLGITWPVWLAHTYTQPIRGWGDWLGMIFDFQPDHWSARSVPLLPVADGSYGPPLDFLWLLIVSAGVMLVYFRIGLACHAGVLIWAILQDEIRLQPQVISPLLLLAGTLPGPAGRDLARIHLGTLWFYAGLHKLLSPRFASEGVHIFPNLFLFPVDESTAQALVVAIPLAEMLLGVMVFVPSTRIFATIGGVVLHLLIFISASRLPSAFQAVSTGQWEASLAALDPATWPDPVWPWNLLLMAAAPVFLWPWQGVSLSVTWKQLNWPARVVAIMLLATPLTYYLGWWHAYLSHCLVSGNVVRGYRLPREKVPRFYALRPPGDDIWAWLQNSDPATREKFLVELPRVVQADLRVSLPPSVNILQRLFARIANKGDQLLIKVPQLLSQYSGAQSREIIHGTVDGLKQGDGWVEYDQEERPLYSGGYVDDKEEGWWIEWRPDGTKALEGEYRAGIMHGRWRVYGADGSVREHLYIEGRQVE
ncbi:MAG: hypothetical protein SFX18_18565 [Pirellulales bacterium]|nr:hypothetical protein [Pirellulales bacterium]